MGLHDDGLAGPHGSKALLDEADRLEKLVSDLRRIAVGSAPDADDLADAPVAEGWAIGLRSAWCIVADGCGGHPRGVGVNGPFQTSELWAINPRGAWVRTYSRWYRLGARSVRMRPS